MNKVYREYKGLDLKGVSREVLEEWEENNVFEQSIALRKEAEPYVFYEGPPSANGMPGIHHVMARSIKDIFCRYKTLKGFVVNRKAGWDTHGLPIELGVEKELGITKEDIGKKISVDDYNKACKEAVMRYTDKWNELTRQIGYWVDLENPYITYKTKYIESVWYLLSSMYKKDLIYKGYTIQPYSPAAGSGLSTHELNQPGCYRDVKDTSVTAQFKVIKTDKSDFLFNGVTGELFFLAWTTTPWTLPSNTALAVGKNIRYLKVNTFNQYTGEKITVILAKDLLAKHFSEKNKDLDFEAFKLGDKNIPFKVIGECEGKDLVGCEYEQLLKYCQPEGDAFKVISGDFVTTEDGTGIVHIAPTFGADDARVAKEFGISPMLVKDENGNDAPLVDLKGRFVKEVTEFAGEPVKIDYYTPDELKAEMNKQGAKSIKELKSVDVKIAIKLKEENRAFKVERYEHSYPHCWRTDKPILYYPLDSWFVKTTAKKKELIQHNKTINWKPKWTGERRFGEWLENLQDWNLSRSRYWGIPIPIWTSEDKTEQICIGSLAELKQECEKSVKAGIMSKNPLEKFTPENFSEENYDSIDLHRPYVDDIVLVSPTGKPMTRELDLIDVWFDSGSMPYAQLHYPFENKELFEKNYPADFIAEGVDQTRGWFYTLHAIGVLCFDSIAYKNVVSNGLVLDKNGQKMSKRLGNAVDPFITLKNFGPDSLRWYMISNAQPWDDLKFDTDGIGEVQRKFFGTLYNTYQFYAVYANLDNFKYTEAEIPLEKRPRIDRWVLSRLNSLIAEVDSYYTDYEPTKAARAVQKFTLDHLSNWYVRLCRRRFWKGEYSEDKIAAYQTLYRCLEVIAQLSAPIAPFYADRLFKDLNDATQKQAATSVHLSNFPVSNQTFIDKNLEEEMDIAMKYSSMVLSLRKTERLRVRQPLQKILVPVLNEKFEKQINSVKDLILSEVNVKEMELLTESSDVLVKKIKPNFKSLGPKYGKQMKALAAKINTLTKDDIALFEREAKFIINLEGSNIELALEDVEITSEDIPGWQVVSEGGYTVALDITVTEVLKEEGIARELVNKIQNLRKDKGLQVTDGIILSIKSHDNLNSAINNNLDYICSETLTKKLEIVDELSEEGSLLVDLEDDAKTLISISKLN